MLLRKLLYILCLAFLLFNRVKCYYFNIVNESILKRVEETTCFRQHYVSFKNQLLKVCLYYKSTEYPKYTFNIYIYKVNEEDKWEKKNELIIGNTNRNIRYFYTFSTEDKIIVVFCYNMNLYRTPCKCFYSTSYDGITFETKRTALNYIVFNYLSVTDYYSKHYDLFGENFLLMCGINHQIIHDNSKNLIVCFGSNNDGKSWDYKFNFRYLKANINISYFMLKLIISGNEIGFKYVTSEAPFSATYIKCKYKSMHDFYCDDVDLKIGDKIIRDIVKVGGYYLTSQSDTNLSTCQLYYVYNSVVLAPANGKSEGYKCHKDNFFPLENSRLIYSFENENLSYSYVFRYTGSVKHCTLLYFKKDDLNPGFIRGSDNVYSCTIKYDELIVEGDDRYFVLSVLNEVKTDLKKCFHFSYDNLLYPVNIIHKIDTVTEYENYKLYIFHIKKDIENFFYEDKTLHCDLGDNFTMKLDLNYKNSFVIDNTSPILPTELKLHNNNIIYYKIPNLRSKNQFLSNISFPPQTKYIKKSDIMYIFKMPPYIKDKIESSLYFINKSNKVEKKPIIFNKGGAIPNLIGVDFSNLDNSCSYGFASNRCEYIRIEGNKINVDVSAHTDSDVMLGMICPVDSNNQNICFNDVYDNDKKVFIRDYFEDNEGLLTILPKTYIHIPGSSITYEESNLIIGREFLEKLYKNRSNYKNSLVCKCYMNKVHYEVTFNLSQNF
ncbi:secreted ookinete protein, putative [Plasmodium relictum]|uniref:Secreted ookinete protein, putative n=1 Tax=Plasmodium relictum TaxID=85471 RepID=A0A1J1H6H7_PLARL|nr:secreted ookinete protein, putative [Plasmodium relictum]CRH00528.1 secreted ookinete protein, putative [Plasmodium relictum]